MAIEALIIEREREALFKGDIDLARCLYYLGAYQDDITTKTIEPLAQLVDDQIKYLCSVDKYNIPLNTDKDEPFVISYTTIGALFPLGMIDDRGIEPSGRSKQKYQLLQNELQTKFDRNEQIDFEEFLEITGLMYWVAQFYNRPNLTCSPAYEVLRQAREQATDKISITEDLMRNINSLQENIRQRTNLMPIIQDARFLTFDRKVAGDASTIDGWGFHIGYLFAFGKWDEETKLAIKRCRDKIPGSKISISPLELFVQALMGYWMGTIYRMSQHQDRSIKQHISCVTTWPHAKLCNMESRGHRP